MRNIIFIVLFAFAFCSCNYHVYPDYIIKYKGKCWRMKGHKVTAQSYNVKGKDDRYFKRKIKRKNINKPY